MTPRERAALRDKVARARLADELQDAAADKAASAKPTQPPRKPTPKRRQQKRTEPRYPVTSRSSIIECPVHQLTVALNEHGRICSACPECAKEADAGIERLEMAA